MSHIFIDEAHCTVQWPDDFRPKYRDLDVLRDVFPNVAVVALSATATFKIQGDIQRLLYMKEALVISAQLDRSNIQYAVQKRPSQSGKHGVDEYNYTSVFAPMLQELKNKGTTYPKTVVYTGLKWCGFEGEQGVKVLAKACVSTDWPFMGCSEFRRFHQPTSSDANLWRMPPQMLRVI